jgi:hypothetical protein
VAAQLPSEQIAGRRIEHVTMALTVAEHLAGSPSVRAMA